MRNFFWLLFCAFLVSSCRETKTMDEFDIPSDFKVRSISDGFSDYEFLYADTLITSIIENVFGTSYTLFYTDGLLDSIKIVLNDSLRTASATSIVYFKRSSKGKIVEINKEQYPLRVRYNKEEQDIEEIEVRQLLRSEYYSYRDSLVYDQEHDLVEMHRHRTGDFPEKVFIRELEKTVNLFWWVSNKLGFP